MTTTHLTLTRRWTHLGGGERTSVVGPLLEEGVVFMMAGPGPPGFITGIIPSTLECLLIDTDHIAPL